MSRDSAVFAALDLHKRPSLSMILQGRPLPDDVLLVIKGAAGCPDTMATLRARTGAPADLLREACAFYIQRVMLFQRASPYRILGADHAIGRDELRQRLRWLLLWLHPDHNRDEWQAVYARRVIEAWKAVSGEAGSASLPSPVALGRRSARFRQTWVKHPVPRARSRHESGATRRTSLRLVLLSSAFYLLAPAAVSPAHGTQPLAVCASVSDRGPCAR